MSKQRLTADVGKLTENRISRIKTLMGMHLMNIVLMTKQSIYMENELVPHA